MDIKIENITTKSQYVIQGFNQTTHTKVFGKIKVLGKTKVCEVSSSVHGHIAENVSILTNEREKAFQKEYEAFLSMSEKDKQKYNGKYVVIHDGKVADVDIDESKLVSRFFKKHGNVRVYIDKVGGEEIIPKARSPRKVE